MLKELMQERSRLEQEIAVLEMQLANVNTDISEAVSLALADCRKLQGKEFGAVHVVAEGFKVTETVPKRVKWDQEKLASIYKAIKDSGDEPLNYMKVELLVPERLYEQFGQEVQDIFVQARIVEKGKPQLKIEEVG